MALAITKLPGVTIFTCKRGPEADAGCQFPLRGRKAGQFCGRRTAIRFEQRDYCKAHGQMLIREKDGKLKKDPEPAGEQAPPGQNE